MKTKDNVNHPSHYTQYPVEAIDIIEGMTFPTLSNAFKYVWRAGMKGEWKEDLEKAEWYLNRFIEREHLCSFGSTYEHKKLTLSLNLLNLCKEQMPKQVYEVLREILMLDNNQSDSTDNVLLYMSELYDLHINYTKDVYDDDDEEDYEEEDDPTILKWKSDQSFPEYLQEFLSKMEKIKRTSMDDSPILINSVDDIEHFNDDKYRFNHIKNKHKEDKEEKNARLFSLNSNLLRDAKNIRIETEFLKLGGEDGDEFLKCKPEETSYVKVLCFHKDEMVGKSMVCFLDVEDKYPLSRKIDYGYIGLIKNMIYNNYVCGDMQPRTADETMFIGEVVNTMKLIVDLNSKR